MSMRQTWRPALFVAILALLIVPLTTRAGSIFDDDYVPPSSKAPRQPPPPTVPPTNAKPPTPRPAEGTALPPRVTPPALNPAAPTPRNPVPAPAAQATSRKLLKEAFAKELADRSPAARRALAQRLLAEATKTADNPTDQFVLLAGARQAAMEAGNWALALKAADAIAAAFTSDPLAMKLETIAKVPPKADDVVTIGDNCRAGLALIDQLVAADDYAGATRLANLIGPASANDPFFGPLVQRRTRDLAPLAAAHDRVRPDFQKLAAAPDDPKANLAVGEFLCFHKGDWSTGLPMLAKSSDATVATLAKADLDAPTTADAMQSIGDGWWDLAEKLPEAARTHVRQHAAVWYAKAIDAGASGLHRAAMEKRIADATVGPRLVNLLSFCDPQRDTAYGQWAFDPDGALVCPRGESKIDFPYVPPREYVVRVQFVRTEGDEVLTVWAPKGDAGLNWTISAWANTQVGFERINGRDLRDNPSRVNATHWVDNNRETVTVLEMRDNRVRAYLDGRMLEDWKTTDYREFSYWGSPPRDPKRLAVGSRFSAYRLTHVEVLELTGAGSIVQK